MFLIHPNRQVTPQRGLRPDGTGEYFGRMGTINCAPTNGRQERVPISAGKNNGQTPIRATVGSRTRLWRAPQNKGVRVIACPKDPGGYDRPGIRGGRYRDLPRPEIYTFRECYL